MELIYVYILLGLHVLYWIIELVEFGFKKIRG